MGKLSTGGERLYAIGDVHGRRDLLDVALERVAADLRARPHPRPRIVFLGDYVDRGPDSRGVIERLIALEREAAATTFLLGNHDACLLGYLRDPTWTPRGLHWFHAAMGGAATLASYGLRDIWASDPAAAHDAFQRAFPPAHREFLERCSLTLAVGDYLLVHAGVRPGVPMAAQAEEDLLWIREPFLSARGDFGFKVIHGHTIVRFVEHRANRIAADTGAVKTGVLSCVVVEGAEAALLTSAGAAPLPVGAGIGVDRATRRLAEGVGQVGAALRALLGWRRAGAGQP
jgi:serine/threonine protein phosphatase 1